MARATNQARARASATVVLETDQLRLRTWSCDDAAEFDRSCNTQSVMRWLGGVQTRSAVNDDVRYFIECQEGDGYTFWVLERRSDDAFLGFCGFVDIPDEDSTVYGELEIGWRIRADMWRNGFAEEAARACLNWASRHVPKRRIVSRTAETNLPSRKLMEKLGLRHCAKLDYDPEDGGERLVVYTLRSAIKART